MQMMKQPELGRKIAELRKAKGLTQEELVERCGLNVRTVQRIEAGEVTPRTYTVRVIFEALDFRYYDRSGSVAQGLRRVRHFFVGLWQGFVSGLAELFNLKTHTMRKLSILSAPFLLALVILVLGNRSAEAQERMAILSELENRMAEQPGVSLFNEGNFDALVEVYADSAYMLPDAYPAIVGREAIRAYYSQLYDRNIRFREIRSEWSVISDSLAVERGTWIVNVNAAFDLKGSYLTQWRYRNGKWEIENEVSRSDVPYGLE